MTTRHVSHPGLILASSHPFAPRRSLTRPGSHEYLHARDHDNKTYVALDEGSRVLPKIPWPVRLATAGVSRSVQAGPF
jgi:hypothetical protein